MTNEMFDAVVAIAEMIAYRECGNATNQRRAGSKEQDLEDLRGQYVTEDEN